MSIKIIYQLLNEDWKDFEIHYQPWLIDYGLISKTTKDHKIIIIDKEYISNNIILFKK